MKNTLLFLLAVVALIVWIWPSPPVSAQPGGHLIDEAQVRPPTATATVFRVLTPAGRRELTPDSSIAVNLTSGTFGAVLPAIVEPTLVVDAPAITAGQNAQLSQTPLASRLFLVFRNGVLQQDGAHFIKTTATPPALQFAVPLKTGDVIQAFYYR